MSETKWDKEHLLKAKSKGEELIASTWVNKRSEQYCKTIDHILASMVSLGVFCIGYFKDHKVMKDGIIYIAFTIGLIPIIQKIFNFSGKASMYETTQKSYDAITEKIIEEIADKKNDPVHFMQDINKEIRFVNKKAPNVYGFVLKKFANKFKKMATPITLDQIDIFIDVDNEDSTEPKEEKKNTNEQKEQKELSETIEDSRQLLSKEFESRLDKRTGTNSAFGFELRRYEEQ